MKQFVLLFIVNGLFTVSMAQKSGSVTGTVINKNLLSPLPSVTVEIAGTGMGTKTDSIGKFRLTGLLPKTYNMSFSSVGYQPQT